MQYPLLGDVRNRTFSPPFFGGNQLVGSFILHYFWYILMGSVDQERAKQKMQGIQDWWLCFSNFSIIFPGSLLFGTCRLVYHQIPYCNLLQGYFGSMHWHAQFSDTLKCALNPDMTFLAPKKYASRKIRTKRVENADWFFFFRDFVVCNFHHHQQYIYIHTQLYIHIHTYYIYMIYYIYH